MAATFLGRLRSDVRGNTLALMAAFTIPAAALAGSAIDTARLYVVKVRLQQACDAGALAGRKFMVDSNSTTIDSNASTQANSFFANNFRTGWMGTTAVSFAASKTSDNQVAGAASATVPMTLMNMFGAAPVTLPITCEARYDVADADIMFVLDTTGSMACTTSDDQSTCDNYAFYNTVQNGDGSHSVTEKSSSRIAGLRGAVLTFYDTVTASADPSTHFRFGFVPYTATVNVGTLLPRSYIATSSWTYQSRVQTADVASGSASNPAATVTTKPVCDSYVARSPTSGYLAADFSYQNTTSAWTATSGGNGNCQKTIQKYVASFTYQPQAWNIGSFASGSAVTTPTMPQMPPGVIQPTSSWNGCIEERDTVVASSFSATSPPPDLDVDTPPVSESTRWRPMWPEVSFARTTSGAETTTALRTPDTRYHFYGYGAWPLNELPCPKRAARLATMARSDISNYVNAADFRPYGDTYHDVGMTWGTRLLSPTGMFASDTAAWPGHDDPSRYIIFLTDGAMETDAYAYSAHGLEQWDQRVAGGNPSQLNNYHNARFGTACTIAKNRNIKIFVIAYAQTLTTDLTNCASPGQAFQASNTAALNTAFTQIAQQIAMLRITK